ncbi:MAG: SIS domain-containing protein [Acidimicrobiia bacterium]|nr:SIS domain-containing protein [Acidimicrobiia bacterium]
MCGIIAIVRRRTTRQAPDPVELGRQLQLVDDRLGPCEAAAADLEARLALAADAFGALDTSLRGEAGVTTLIAQRDLLGELEVRTAAMRAQLVELEADLDRNGELRTPAQLETAGAALIVVKDRLWAVAKDRLRTARAVLDLAGPAPRGGAVASYLAIQEALSGIDRLEVRGRDSAGLQVLVRGHDLALDDATVQAQLAARADELFGTGTVEPCAGSLSFVYKAAAEIGELGDNTRVIRAAIAGDDLLRRAVSSPDAEVIVLGHTRWASVGIISGPNAHPLNATELGGSTGPYVTAALNGDVDNFADLKASHGLRIRPEITTDAKVIPTLTSRALAEGLAPAEAFRRTVTQLEGSVAIGAAIADHPDQVLLALRGSGQALYVGLAEDLFVVASEPYGLVELADRFLRMDGETPADPNNPTGSRGQVVELSAGRAGELAGLRRWSYDGELLGVTERELVTPQITTRDIDRGDAPHFLLKEIGESPASFRKTLRGKLVERAGSLDVELGPETLPDAVREALASGTVRSVAVIGQGTAAVAGQGLVLALRSLLATSALSAQAIPATELSGFHLRSDLSDVLVVAISQSGTTTDTNRTVDLVRSRGAHVVSIVNRRNSDLVDRSDGVLYTSDGRDVEMSVASTKAFYSQIAAGFLLAGAIARIVEPDALTRPAAQELLAALRDLPGALVDTLGLRAEVADAARRFAPSRRHWALVGNGPNRIAAHEVRIKLSELCYKSIACDVTEDKKHIDLSAEPLVLVCAAGLSGSTAEDVAKEVGIYRAHQAAPLVVASESGGEYPAALAVIRVPDTHPSLAFVLATMVGHLFGYEAALAIDALAIPMRQGRAAVEAAISSAETYDLAYRLRVRLEPVAGAFFDGLRAGSYNGCLEALTATRVASLLRYGLGHLPLEAYQLEHGKVGTPAVVVEDLARALTAGIDELTRPIDAIKHQAKTVTVGISRSEEGLLETTLVRAVLDAGTARDRLSYEVLRTLASLSPVVTEVTGFTRYRIEGDPRQRDARIAVVDRGGISLDLPLRTEADPRLRGTKHQVAIERQVLVSRGRSDGRLLVIVPEVKDGQTTGITLLHVRFPDELPLGTLRSALNGYRNRFTALEDMVMETEPTFREDLLETVPLPNLFADTISSLADRWRV